MLTMKRLTKINMIKHVSVIILFIITSLLFFSPVLEGKKIFQQDIMLYDGMAKELRDYREKNGEETYWVNNAFSGIRAPPSSPEQFKIKKLITIKLKYLLIFIIP